MLRRNKPFLRSDSRKNPRRALSRAQSLEPLEPRWLLSGNYFQDIAAELAGHLHTVADSVGEISSGLQVLPLINVPLQDIAEISRTLDTEANDLSTAFGGLSPQSQETDITQTLLATLGPDGANILLDRDGGGVGMTDISVTSHGESGIDITIDIGQWVGVDPLVDVGLGVYSIPFQTNADTIAGFSVGLLYRNFNFGFSNDQAYVTTSAADELKFKIIGNLPKGPETDMHAGLGFLSFKVTNMNPAEVNDLDLTLSADITDTLEIAAPRLDGAVHLLLKLSAETSDEALPQFKTDFKFDWSFASVHLDGGKTQGASDVGSFGVPLLSLNNVQMNLGSLLGDIVRPVADRAQLITEPLQPVLDLLTKRIPAVSELAGIFGGGDVTLVQLSKLLSALPNPPVEFINAIQTAEKLRNFAETVTALAGTGHDKWINLGDFAIVGLDGPKATLGSAIGNWSSLSALPGGVNFDGVKDQIKSLLGDEVGGDVNSLWDALIGEWQENGLTVDIPLVKNPAGVAMAMLLGQDIDLIKVTARFHLGFDRDIPFTPPPINLGINLGGNFDAFAEVGFDTRGLRTAIAPMYRGLGLKLGHLWDGLWINKYTGMHADAHVELSLSAGIPNLATIGATGGVSGNLNLNLFNIENFNQTHDADDYRVRPWVGDLGDALFHLDGELAVSAGAELKAGFEILGQWIGIKHTWEFASGTLFKFDTDRAPIPPELIPPSPVEPPRVGKLENGTLTLATGPNAALRAGIGGVDETFTVKRVNRHFIYSIDSNKLGEAVLIGDLIDLDALQVTAFGMTEVFHNVQHVVANMGEGNDVLNVTDRAGTVDYIINAGDGDDAVRVRGGSTVDIQGGAGNDTLDAGNGMDFIYLDGGDGENQLSIGNGNLNDVRPGWASISIHNGHLILDNSQETLDTEYSLRYDTLNFGGWVLRTDNAAGSHDFHYDDNVPLRLMSGSGNDVFHGGSAGTTLFGGGGDDVLYPAFKGINAELPEFHGSFGFSGGDGTDSIIMDDSHATDFTIVGFYGNNAAEQTINWGDTHLAVSGLENAQLTVKPHSYILFGDWNAAPIDVYHGEVLVMTEVYLAKNSSIHLHDTEGFGLLDTHPDAGPDYMGLDAVGPFVSIGNGKRLDITFDGSAKTVVYAGTTLTVDPAAGYVAEPWSATFGIAGGNNLLGVGATDSNAFVRGPQTIDYTYRYSGTTLTIGGLTIGTTDLATLAIDSGPGNDTFEIDSLPAGAKAYLHGNAGDDELKVGSDAAPFSSMAGQVFWFGGDGVDSMIVNDRGNQTGQVYTITSSNTLNIGNGIYAAPFDDTTEVLRLDAAVNVSGEFHLHSSRWSINGGDFFDQFYISDFGLLAGTATIDPGLGINSLFLTNEGALGPLTIYADHLKFGDLGGELYYSKILAIQYAGATTNSVGDGAPENIVYVASTCLDTALLALEGTAQAVDTFNLGSDDGVTGSLDNLHGAIAIETHSQLDGLADTVKYIDSASTAAHTYDVHNLELSRDGVALPMAAGAAAVELVGGAGNDTFNIHSFHSGVAMTIDGASGSDVINITPDSKNIGANIGSGALLNLRGGGGGYDILYLYNDNNPFPWTYTRTTDALRAEYHIKASDLWPDDSDYVLDLHDDMHRVWAFGGAKDDRFRVLSTRRGFDNVFTGGGGDDVTIVGDGRTQDLHGRVWVGTESLVVDDSADTIGRTVHTSPFLICATEGDNLFGEGGYIYHPGAWTTTIRLGSGNDVVYARPTIYGPAILGQPAVTIDGGTGFDTLNLALAGLDGYSIVGDSSTGIVTPNFPYFKELGYSQFEQRVIDDVAPQILSAGYDPSIPSIDIQFSEDVSNALFPGHLALFNQTAGYYFTDMHLDYDAGTNIAHFVPNYTSQVFPAGNYHASIVSTTDSFGNPLYADPANSGLGDAYTFDFTVQANLFVDSGHVELTGTQTFASVDIGDGASVSSAGLLITNQLNIQPGGTLDLTSAGMILDYTEASPLASIDAMILQGRNGGDWNGAGITSSAAAATQFTTLAAMESADYKALYGQNALFEGQPVDDSAVLIKYTWYGDTDLTGAVDADDYFRIDSGFASAQTGWVHGDFDGSGGVDADDYFLIDSSFAGQSAPLADAPIAAPAAASARARAAGAAPAGSPEKPERPRRRHHTRIAQRSGNEWLTCQRAC